ncbi:MAG: hypothetical protein V4560_14945 [Bacteroidota bacterium]
MAKDDVVITFKCSPILKEALRQVAFDNGHSSSSRIIKDSLETNEQLQLATKKLLKKVKK